MQLLRYLLLVMLAILLFAAILQAGRRLLQSPQQEHAEGVVHPENRPLPRDSVMAYIDTATIDRHARNVPKEAGSSISALASYLVKPARNDYEKARALFIWMTDNIEYDVDAFFRGSHGDVSAGGVLKGRKSVCQGYSSLYEDLAAAAGLKCVAIPGTAKGYGYSVLEPLRRESNHAWNAVSIDHRWYLMDCTWGAGSVSSERGAHRFIKEFQDFFCFTNPDEFIYAHFPDDAQWQLLPSEISWDEFTRAPYYRPEIFTSRIVALDHRESSITADSDLVLQFKAPPNVRMMAKLISEDSRVLDDRCTFVQGMDSLISVNVAFPRKGKYVLRLFGGPKEGESSITDKPYRWLTDYAAEAGTERHAAFLYPKCYAVASKIMLVEPRNGSLKTGTTVRFKILAPHGQDIAVVSGNVWHHLPPANNAYEDTIAVQGPRVKVVVRKDSTSANYSVVYEFETRKN